VADFIRINLLRPKLTFNDTVLFWDMMQAIV